MSTKRPRVDSLKEILSMPDSMTQDDGYSYTGSRKRGQIQDPDRLTMWRARLDNKVRNISKYGRSTKQVLRNLAKGVDGAQQQIDNRLADGYSGSGRYKRRRYPVRRKSYQRYRGRGSFKLGKQMLAAGNVGKKLIGKDMLQQLQGKAMYGMGSYYGGRGAFYGGRGSYTGYNDLFPGQVDKSFAMSSSGDEQSDVIFTNREYVGDIFGNNEGVLFNNASYALNPGIEKTFPWLSQLAVNFTEYEFKQLIFEYEPLVQADQLSAGQVGQAIMATQYNPDTADFSNKFQMMQYAHSNAGAVIYGLTHGVECDPDKNAGDAVKYVRSQPILLNGADALRYDQGTFQFAINGTPTAYNDEPIGQLYVYYTVRLSKPRIRSALGLTISTDRWANGQTAYVNTTASLLGDKLEGIQNSILGTLTDVAGSDSEAGGFKYTFPTNYVGNVEMTYRATYYTNTVAAALPTPTWVLTNGLSEIPDMYAAGAVQDMSPSAYEWSPEGDSSGYTIGTWVSVTFKIHLKIVMANDGAGNSISIDFPATVTNLAQIKTWSLVVQEYNPTESTPPVYKNSVGIQTTPA